MMKFLGAIVLLVLLISGIWLLFETEKIKIVEEKPPEQKAKVETVFGCLKTTLTVSEFEKKNYYFGKLFNRKVKGCDYMEKEYQGPVRPGDDLEYFRKTGITREDVNGN